MMEASGMNDIDGETLHRAYKKAVEVVEKIRGVPDDYRVLMSRVVVGFHVPEGAEDAVFFCGSLGGKLVAVGFNPRWKGTGLYREITESDQFFELVVAGLSHEIGHVLGLDQEGAFRLDVQCFEYLLREKGTGEFGEEEQRKIETFVADRTEDIPEPRPDYLRILRDNDPRSFFRREHLCFLVDVTKPE